MATHHALGLSDFHCDRNISSGQRGGIVAKRPADLTAEEDLGPQTAAGNSLRRSRVAHHRKGSCENRLSSAPYPLQIAVTVWLWECSVDPVIGPHGVVRVEC